MRETEVLSCSLFSCLGALNWLTSLFVSARSADILSSRCMYVCLLTPEFVPHGSRLLPRFPNRNNMAARMSGMAEGPPPLICIILDHAFKIKL